VPSLKRIGPEKKGGGKLEKGADRVYQKERDLLCKGLDEFQGVFTQRLTDRGRIEGERSKRDGVQ